MLCLGQAYKRLLFNPLAACPDRHRNVVETVGEVAIKEDHSNGWREELFLSYSRQPRRNRHLDIKNLPFPVREPAE